MRKQILRIGRSSKKGSSLILVLFLSAAVITLCLGFSMAAVTASKVSEKQIEAQQAYFTARSAVDAYVKYLKSISNDQLKNLLTGASGEANKKDSGIPKKFSADTNMGYYKVEIYKEVDALGNDTGDIVVTGYGYYPSDKNGEQRSITSKLYHVSGTVPFNDLFYINGNGNLGQSKVDGKVTAKGSLVFGHGTSVYNDVTAEGDVTISDGGTAVKNLVSGGTVTIKGGATISGNLTAVGDLIMTGGTHVNGIAKINGKVNLTSGPFVNSVYANSAYLDGGSTINNLYLPGSISPSINGGSTVLTTTHSSITMQSAPVIPDLTVAAVPPNLSTHPGYNSNVSFSAVNYVSAYVHQFCKCTISDDGILTAATVNSFCGYNDATITVDTSVKDIYLKVTEPINFNMLSLKVTGPNKLYIFLSGPNASITLNSTCYVGNNVMQNDGSTYSPNLLYIIGDSNTTQKVSINSNSVMNAYIYMPHGTFHAEGSGISAVYKDKFRGSVIAASVDTATDCKFTYVKPDDTGSILSTLYNSWSDKGWY